MKPPPPPDVFDWFMAAGTRGAKALTRDIALCCTAPTLFPTHSNRCLLGAVPCYGDGLGDGALGIPIITVHLCPVVQDDRWPTNDVREVCFSVFTAMVASCVIYSDTQ